MLSKYPCNIDRDLRQCQDVNKLDKVLLGVNLVSFPNPQYSTQWMQPTEGLGMRLELGGKMKIKVRSLLG